MLKRIYNGVCYLILFAVVLLLADFYKHPLFLLLAAYLITFVPISYYVCKYAFARLSCAIDFSVTYGNSDDTALVSLKLISQTHFVLPNCEITYQISSPFYPCEEIRKVVCPVYAKNAFSFVLPVHFKRAGMYDVTIHQIAAYDYLHIFRFTKKLVCHKELMIYPQAVDIGDFDQTSYGEGFDEFEESTAKGNVSSNVTDIREYIPGDRLQKIHWKLSSKIKKLMIKENEATATNQFSLLVELYLDQPESDYLDLSLSYAISVAQTLLDAGEPFFFLFFSIQNQDFIKTFIKTKEDFDMAIMQCFYQSSYPQKDLALTTLLHADLVHGVLLHATHEGVSDVIS